MYKLMERGTKFIRQMDLTDMALLKFCLLAFGVLAGLKVSDERKNSMKSLAKIVFWITYFPLIFKFFRTDPDQEHFES